MSNPLSSLRTAVKTALEDAGFTAYSTVPSKMVPPCMFVGPGDPYISREGAAFGGEIVRHQVVIVAAAGVNETSADSLDDLTLRVLDVLYSNDDWSVGDTDRPGQINLGGQSYLATAIEIQQEIHREAP